MKTYVIKAKDSWTQHVEVVEKGSLRFKTTSDVLTLSVNDTGNGIRFKDPRGVETFIGYGLASDILASLLILLNEGENITNFDIFENLPVAKVGVKEKEG